MKTTSSSSSCTHAFKESPKAVEKQNDKETIEEECNGVTETLMRAVGTVWSEVEETVKKKHSKMRYKTASSRTEGMRGNDEG